MHQRNLFHFVWVLATGNVISILELESENPRCYERGRFPGSGPKANGHKGQHYEGCSVSFIQETDSAGTVYQFTLLRQHNLSQTIPQFTGHLLSKQTR